MAEFIHVLLLKVELGPYSEQQVRDALAAGQLLLSDLARYEPTKEWKPVGEILGNLPQPIIVVPPLLKAEASPGPLPPAVVLVAPVPPEPIIIAPAIAEFVPETLQPAVVLFSPLLPARQLLQTRHTETNAAKPPSDPTPAAAVPATSILPAPQLLATAGQPGPAEDSKNEAPVDSAAHSKLEEREIRSPPKPVVPYNQPIPRPGRTAREHWIAWGKHAAPVLILILLIILASWKMMEPTRTHFWAKLYLL